MSDEPKEEKKEQAPPKTKGRVIAILGLLLVVAVSSVAGAALSPIIGPRVVPPPKPPRAHVQGEAEEEEEDAHEKGKPAEPTGLLTLDAVVVDLRDQNQETHHLKMGMAVELKVHELPEEEAKLFQLRAKDASITYLRTLSFEEVVDHTKFEIIRKELSLRVLKAFGKGRAKKMLITEYVAQ